MPERLLNALMCVVGGVVGGAVGYFAFNWLVDQGFYGLMLPGALIGLGAGIFARNRSILRGIICGVAAIALELFAEWKRFPFEKDESFSFMVAHFHEKAPIKILMLVVGALIAFWLGKDAGFRGRSSNDTKPTRPSDAA